MIKLDFPNFSLLDKISNWFHLKLKISSLWVTLIETPVSQYRSGWPVYILLNCTFDACHFNWLSYHILSYIRKTILHCHGFSPALFQPPTCPADYFNTFPTFGLAILFLKMLWLCRYKHCFPCHELKAITWNPMDQFSLQFSDNHESHKSKQWSDLSACVILYKGVFFLFFLRVGMFMVQI